MKFRLEISAEADEEILLRCREYTEKIKELEKTLASLAEASSDMVLTYEDTEFYVPKKDILFFETADGRVAAHTADRMYYTKYKLFELENLMPKSFLRVSKSCVLNAEAVRSLSHGITGTGEVTFIDSDKTVFVSRAYYKYLKERIYQLRFPTEL